MQRKEAAMSDREEGIVAGAVEAQECQPHNCTAVVEDLVAETDDAAWDEVE